VIVTIKSGFGSTCRSFRKIENTPQKKRHIFSVNLSLTPHPACCTHRPAVPDRDRFMSRRLMKKPLFMQIPTFRDQAEQRIIAAPAELAVISY
jgi:hypothetical protein